MKRIKIVALMLGLSIIMTAFHAKAEENHALTDQLNIFIPVVPGSFGVQSINFNPLVDPETIYLTDIARELPAGFKMKLGLGDQTSQSTNLIGPLDPEQKQELVFAVFASKEVETGLDLTARWAVTEYLDDDADEDRPRSSVILNLHVYTTSPKNLQMTLDKKEVTVNGEEKKLDVPAQVVEGRTLIPFRFMGEQLGTDIGFEMDQETRLVSNVSFKLGKMTVTLWINQQQAEIRIDREYFDVELDVPPMITNGRTLVPVRFVSEQLGADVGWVPERREVNIQFPKAYELPNESLKNFYQHISSDDLYEFMQDEGWFVIDVRDEESFNLGHLPGALHIPAHEIHRENLENLGITLDDHIVLYCNSGNQAQIPCGRLIDQGFLNVYNLEGGIRGWPYDIES